MLIASTRLDQDSRPLFCPGRKLPNTKSDQELELRNAQAALEVCARAACSNFLASDRLDVALTVK